MSSRLIYVCTALVLAMTAWLTLRSGSAERVCDQAALKALYAVDGDTAAVTQPRWSGCFDVAPPRLVSRPRQTDLQSRGAVARLELAARRRSSVAWSDLGVALALVGDTERAITTFDLALVAADDAELLSNRAAARLVRATKAHDPQLAMLALDDAIHASVLNPTNPAARFNAALALTLLDLGDQADVAWRAYLELDMSSEWAEQARAHLENPANHGASGTEAFEQAVKYRHADELTPACVAAPQACREHLQETVLPAWGRAVLATDRTAATARLGEARVLSAALAARGDRLDVDAVSDIERAAIAGGERLTDLATGCDAYGRARAAFEADVPSRDLFVEAERRLSLARSPLVYWAGASRIYADFASYDAQALIDLGSQLITEARDAAKRRYAAVSGRLLYLAALTHANRADYAPAERLFAESLDLLAQTGERQHLAATEWAVGNARFRLGNREEGWRWFARAFASLGQTTNARRRYVILLNAGYWLGNLQLNHAAIRLLTAARDEGLRTNRPAWVAESLLYRARAYARIGELSAARADAVAASPDGRDRGQWGVSERSRMEYLAVRADIELQEQPAQTIEASSQALTFYEGRGFAARVAELRLLRGRAWNAVGDRLAAARDFEGGIATYEGYRRGLTTDQQRVASQEVVWDLYEESIALAATDDPRQALALAERGRARTLLDAVAGTEASASSPLELESHLGDRQRVVYYAALEHELLTWVIGPRETSFFRQRVERVALGRLIGALRSGLASGAPADDWQLAAEQLFALLIAPTRGAVPPGTALIIIPDGALNLVPFAVLRDRARQRMLIDEHEVSVAPSAAMLLEMLNGREQWRRPVRALVAAAPVAEADLPALRGATVEAERIAQLYPEAELLSHGDATRATFVSRLTSADVVHFAGHATVNSEYPLLAGLEFSAEPGAAGASALTADAIAELRLDRTQLVVLAACRTASGPVRRGEGVLSLARPFLIAGVRSVIATLWDIDDEQSAPFVTRLHSHIAKGLSPAAALRQTQRQLRDLTPAAVWAAFITVGTPAMGHD